LMNFFFLFPFNPLIIVNKNTIPITPKEI
jgi:hypothetical protein